MEPVTYEQAYMGKKIDELIEQAQKTNRLLDQFISLIPIAPIEPTMVTVEPVEPPTVTVTTKKKRGGTNEHK